MDLKQVIAQLIAEKGLIDEAIASLERFSTSQRKGIRSWPDRHSEGEGDDPKPPARRAG